VQRRAAEILLILSLFCLALNGVAAAQISVAAPAPQQRFAPAVPKFTVDQQGNLVAPEDKPKPVPDASEQSTLEIPPVPKEFEGCWEGTVSEPDSWQFLEGPRLAGWIPKTYRLCFRRTGNGPFMITFHDTKLDTEFASERGYKISNYDEQTSVVSTDGRYQVLLQSVARMDQHGKILGFLPGPTVTIAASTDMRCVLLSEDEAINVESSSVDRCSGSPSFGCNGQDWVKATWHAQFHRAQNTDP